MKNLYFELDNIDSISLALLNKVGKRTSFNYLNPVLLVLDMQKFFLEKDSHAFVPSSKAIIPKILTLVRLFEKLNLPIIFSQHINSIENARNMATWWKDVITEKNPLSEISSQFNINSGILIQKSQYDAFFQTNLDKILKDYQITDVITTGVMTHLCCETTARSAFIHGYKVWFPVDGTATYNVDFHLSTLRNLGHGFANLVLMDDIIQSLENNSINEA